MLEGTVFKEPLGAGAFGVVLKATDRDGLDHAIKLCYTHDSESPEVFRREREILLSLPSHPNVVRGIAAGTVQFNRQELTSIQDLVAPYPFSRYIYHFEISGNSKFQVLKMELCGEALRDWGMVCQNTYSDKRTLRHAQYRIVMGIMDGVKFLHSQLIVHRDLKPDKILFSAKGFALDVKIADLGSSRRFPHHTFEMTSHAGTIIYMAPECDRSDYNELCDLFSVGLIMWEVLSLISPSSKPELFRKLVCDRDKSVISYNPYFPNAREMIMSLTSRDPTERLTHWNSPLLVADLPTAQYHNRMSYTTISKQVTAVDRTDFFFPRKTTNEEVLQAKIGSPSNQHKSELCELIKANHSVTEDTLNSAHQDGSKEKRKELTEFMDVYPSVQSKSFWMQKLLSAMEHEFLHAREIVLDRTEIIKSVYGNILDTVVSEYTNKMNHFLSHATYIDDRYVQEQNENFMQAAMDQFHRLSKEKESVLNALDIQEMRRQIHFNLGNVYQDIFSRLTDIWQNIKSKTSNFRRQQLDEFETDAQNPPPECIQDVLAYDAWLEREMKRHLTSFKNEFLNHESKLGEREYQLFEWDIRDLRPKFFKSFNAEFVLKHALDKYEKTAILAAKPECANTATVRIHDVVTILCESVDLLPNCEKFYKSLNIPCVDIIPLYNNYRTNVTSGYSLLSRILSTWVVCIGNDATTDSLAAVLRKEGFVSAGDTVKATFPHASRLVEKERHPLPE